MRLYAIGDIHGQRDMLRAAHARIAADRDACGDAGAPVVHLGDLGDRGADTRGVLEELVTGIAAGAPWRTVMGNHDQLMLQFLETDLDAPGRAVADRWLRGLGGRETLLSYGIDSSATEDLAELQRLARAALPESHLHLLRAMPAYLETDDLILVHAGIRPGVPMSRQSTEDLFWIREGFLDDSRDHGRLVVHGHTPVETPEHHGNRVNLDTGAGFFRPMTAAVFEGRDCWILTEEGRRPLRPEEG
jgi:serine/threonine protein phosphatase 1